MPTLFPTSLDAFANPSSSNILGAANPALRHSVQHININDSVAAMQAQMGITGSLVGTSMEFRLHNVDSGHNHDGINSRPIVLGPPCTGSLYLSGVFSFTQQTQVGCAIDQINQFLSGSLSGSLVTFQWEGVTQGDSGVTSTVNLLGTGVSASYIGNTTTYEITKGLVPSDRVLILLANNGPFEDYPGAFRECLVHKKIFPSASIWYTDNTKTLRIAEEVNVYGSKIVPDQKIFRVYDTDGTTVLKTVTDTIYYQGVFEISRSRNIL